ncbi:hypothetical protein Pyn_22466 [Prunus yedoensis var. nudiflora]|uniref:Pentatricopeptide repeat-containing protein n=1 Tax=Prunus yedoensis var. nudiflora TaxID=2094558 RepID=A0A314ZBG3_PRUYE|nr:hypothetical protein Pyn_22466 [Prunus yedoensis var. nudiflora]
MLAVGVSPSIETYNFLLGGLSGAGLMTKAEELFGEMKNRGFVPNASTYDILVSGHGKIGNKKEAIRLYCEMTRGTSPNSSTYNILICGWCKISEHPELERNLKRSYRDEAKRLLTDMNEKGYVPCESTLRCISSTLARPGKKADARRLLKELYIKKNI